MNPSQLLVTSLNQVSTTAVVCEHSFSCEQPSFLPFHLNFFSQSHWPAGEMKTIARPPSIRRTGGPPSSITSYQQNGRSGSELPGFTDIFTNAVHKIKDRISQISHYQLVSVQHLTQFFERKIIPRIFSWFCWSVSSYPHNQCISTQVIYLS